MKAEKADDPLETPIEYVKPEVADYGSLRELTTSAGLGEPTDLPKSTLTISPAIFS